ncbi:hypothetical protein GPECTOR_8g4 [Gonium pectorale]|uniref:Uncharacterized protein n=1 Tax=Gonium pectorale TaxID=33097 RepID=A0A150GT91_GONPE|nr:hypothetical protein GPECTOR_8g4 [Gonium pectorale]|eukprot:KXZ53033.1 hypothetical protein GPECTOR_8g4 [Gonium pectorale]
MPAVAATGLLAAQPRAAARSRASWRQLEAGTPPAATTSPQRAYAGAEAPQRHAAAAAAHYVAGPERRTDPGRGRGSQSVPGSGAGGFGQRQLAGEAGPQPALPLAGALLHITDLRSAISATEAEQGMQLTAAPAAAAAREPITAAEAEAAEAAAQLLAPWAAAAAHQAPASDHRPHRVPPVGGEGAGVDSPSAEPSPGIAAAQSGDDGTVMPTSPSLPASPFDVWHGRAASATASPAAAAAVANDAADYAAGALPVLEALRAFTPAGPVQVAQGDADVAAFQPPPPPSAAAAASRMPPEPPARGGQQQQLQPEHPPDTGCAVPARAAAQPPPEAWVAALDLALMRPASPPSSGAVVRAAVAREAASARAVRTAPAAGPSVLYESPSQHLSVSFKIETPPGVDFDRLAGELVAEAHHTVERALGGRGAAAATLAPAGPVAASGSAGAVLAPAGPAGAPRPAGRWLGYSTHMQCLRGCIEVVMRLEFEGEDLGLEELATSLEALEADLGRQVAVVAMRAHGGAAAQAEAGGAFSLEHPIVWVPALPALPVLPSERCSGGLAFALPAAAASAPPPSGGPVVLGCRVLVGMVPPVISSIGGVKPVCESCHAASVTDEAAASEPSLQPEAGPAGASPSTRPPPQTPPQTPVATAAAARSAFHRQSSTDCADWSFAQQQEQAAEEEAGHRTSAGGSSWAASVTPVLFMSGVLPSSDGTDNQDEDGDGDDDSYTSAAAGPVCPDAAPLAESPFATTGRTALLQQTGGEGLAARAAARTEPPPPAATSPPPPPLPSCLTLPRPVEYAGGVPAVRTAEATTRADADAAADAGGDAPGGPQPSGPRRRPAQKGRTCDAAYFDACRALAGRGGWRPCELAAADGGAGVSSSNTAGISVGVVGDSAKASGSDDAAEAAQVLQEEGGVREAAACDGCSGGHGHGVSGAEAGGILSRGHVVVDVFLDSVEDPAPSSGPGGPGPCAEVRVAVKQHGAVVAEVERLRVGPQGASVRLDLSGLEEGAAALLVLPYRQEQHGPAAGQAAEAGVQPSGPGAPAAAPLFYTPILVAPPDVAAELTQLVRRMEEACAGVQPAAALAETAAAPAAAPAAQTDPRFTRALAFTRHFSNLTSDLVSLLMGCARVAEEARVASPPAAAAAAASLEQHVADLQRLGRWLVSYLDSMRMPCTLRYMLQELQATGMLLYSGELMGEEAVSDFLGHLPHERGAGGGTASSGDRSDSGSSSASSAHAVRSMAARASRPYPPVEVPLSSVAFGFNGEAEQRFEDYLYDQTGAAGSFAAAAAAAAAAAGTAAAALGMLRPPVAFADIRGAGRALHAAGRLLAAGLGTATRAFRRSGSGAGKGGTQDNGSSSSGSASGGSIRGGSAVAAAMGRIVWLRDGVPLALLGIPAALLGVEAWAGAHSSARARDRFRAREAAVRAGHVLSMLLFLVLLLVGGWRVAGGAAAPSFSTGLPAAQLLALLLVVLHPISCSVRFRSYRFCWLLDAAVLGILSMARLEFDGGEGAGESRRVKTTAFLQGAAVAGLVLLGSMVATALVDWRWRRRFGAATASGAYS